MGNRSPVAVYYGFREPKTLDLSIEKLYETQPNLQTVVSFIADNMAGLPLQFFERVSDTDRQRVTDSPAAKLFAKPNEDMTTFELVRAWSSDMSLYGRALWLLLDDADSESGYSIRPLPAAWIKKFHGNNPFAPESIDLLKPDGTTVNVPSRFFIFFHNYHPSAPAYGLSPVLALKQSLYEQIEADRYRMQVWKKGGRASAFITRPKDVQHWTPEQAKRFKEDFNKAYGANGSEAGGIPVLEDGMELKTFQLNARDAQWAEARIFTREEVAGIYHLNPAQVWKTNGQTYASAKDNARALYADALAPLLREFENRVNRFLLPRLGGSPSEYCEFNLKEKLRGSFEEQASVMQSSVGAPWLTRNEARAMNNLPAIAGGDELITPLNVIEGAGYLQNSAPAETKSQPVEVKSEQVKIKAHDDEAAAEFSETVLRFLNRQRDSIVAKLGTGSEWWDAERWNRELSEDLEALTASKLEAQAIASMKLLGVPASAFKSEWVEKWRRQVADARAKRINDETKRLIDEAEDPKTAFDSSKIRAERSGSSIAAAVLSFATIEAVRQADIQGYNVGKAVKTWIVTSDNPRAEHIAMNGETVPYNERFSNGFRFPQDPEMESPEQACNCRCEIEVTV